MNTKYVYHYCCCFEKYLETCNQIARFSGTYTAEIKIDNELIYEVFRQNIWDDVKNKLNFKGFKKEEMLIISLNLLHEVNYDD